MVSFQMAMTREVELVITHAIKRIGEKDERI